MNQSIKPASGFSLLLFSLLPYVAGSQNDIRIIKAGFDSIIIYNTAPHAIVLAFGDEQPVHIYRGGGLKTRFKLNVRNVRRTVFKVSYDKSCFDMDVQTCNGIVKPCLGCMLTFVLPTRVSPPVPLFGCSPEKWQQVLNEVIAIIDSDDSEASKRIRFAAICYKCCAERETEMQNDCVRFAGSYLNNPPPAKDYKAQDLITLQEKFALDIYPYHLASFQQPGLTNLEFSKKKYFGFRTSLNFNLYKQKRRVNGAQVTIPFDYQQTPVGFKKNTVSSLPDTGYSWRNFSMGIGYRMFVYGGMYKSFLKNIGVIIDAGVSRNSRSQYVVSTGEITASLKDNRDKAPVSGYFNFGYQMAIFRGIGLYGSYYTTIPLKKDKPSLEAPVLRQFNLGLYLNFLTVNSYQY